VEHPPDLLDFDHPPTHVVNVAPVDVVDLDRPIERPADHLGQAGDARLDPGLDVEDLALRSKMDPGHERGS